MSWLSNNSSEVAALGSIFMDVATLAIIFFNMHQFRLNRRSLNIDINFRVFDLRKRIYRDTEKIISSLRQDDDFYSFVQLTGEDYNPSADFLHFKESIENSKYMFSVDLFHDLERLLFLCENGVSLACKIKRIKEADPDTWTDETTKRIQDLTNRKKEALECILEFDIEQFTPYLNVSNFHKDFITQTTDYRKPNLPYRAANWCALAYTHLFKRRKSVARSGA